MKRTVYIRISNKSGKMDISQKRKFGAIDAGYGNYHKYKPTKTICLNLYIPDEIFTKAQKELDLKIKEAEVNSEINIQEAKEQKK